MQEVVNVEGISVLVAPGTLVGSRVFSAKHPDRRPPLPINYLLLLLFAGLARVRAVKIRG